LLDIFIRYSCLMGLFCWCRRTGPVYAFNRNNQILGFSWWGQILIIWL